MEKTDKLKINGKAAGLDIIVNKLWKTLAIAREPLLVKLLHFFI